MGLRFRRSVKLAPGLRLNFSGSSMSLSAGPRGASMNFGARGAYLNTGIPGTGLYARERVGGLAPSPAAPQTVKMSVTVKVEDDGTVMFLDAIGNPLSPDLVERAKKQQGGAIRSLIQNACDEINAQVEGLSNLHLATPNPLIAPYYEPRAFEESRPSEPTPKGHGVIGFFLKGVRERIDAENTRARAAYLENMRQWEERKAAFEAIEARIKKRIEQDVLTDVETMDTVLSESLQDIVWPRETLVSFDVLDRGKRVFLDVDLPEQGDMPRKTASVPQRNYRLSVKELSPTRVQQLYMRHIHGIGFRLIGEVFSVLPSAEEVVLSAYSQRPDKSTGEIRDEYLYSVRVKRPDWAAIHFDNLAAIDVVDAFSRFELRRDVTKTGLFRLVEPFQP